MDRVNGLENDDAAFQGRWKLWAGLPLIVLAVALAATNGHFNILDDEVLILDTARDSALQTLRLFAAGIGQHEHPPLSDLLVHMWLKVAPGSAFWVRMPFTLCYVGAFAILVALARRLAGHRAAIALAWIALGQRRSLSRYEAGAVARTLEENLRQLGLDVRLDNAIGSSPPPRELWLLEGPFDSSYSLAVVNREFARGLVRAGELVALVSRDGPGPFTPDNAFLGIEPRHQLHGKVR